MNEVEMSFAISTALSFLLLIQNIGSDFTVGIETFSKQTGGGFVFFSRHVLATFMISKDREVLSQFRNAGCFRGWLLERSVPVSDNIRGAILMMASMTAFTVNDAFMKSLSDSLPLFQAIFLRGFGVVLFLGAFAWTQGALTFRIGSRDRWLILLRAGAELVAALLFITALFNMQIANAIAILQALPLTVTLAGALFLAEPVGWRRLVAILLGFVGVLLIIQPATNGFTVYSLYALGAVLLITLRDLAARQVSPQVPSVLIAFITAIAVWAGGGVGLAFEGWHPVEGRVWLLLCAAGVSVVGGYVCSVATMRVGDIGFVSQFRYTSLLVALAIGLVFFDEWPDLMTLIGSALVVATGLFTLWREQRAVNLK